MTTEIDQNKKSIAKLQAGLNDENKSLTTSTDARILMEELNWKIKKDTLRLLYLQQKAYNYWSISNTDRLSPALYQAM